MVLAAQPADSVVAVAERRRRSVAYESDSAAVPAVPASTLRTGQGTLTFSPLHSHEAAPTVTG
jgi:hypothetical protein